MYSTCIIIRECRRIDTRTLNACAKSRGAATTDRVQILAVVVQTRLAVMHSEPAFTAGSV